ncbi:molybdopterin-dependent oxidoreductase [Marivivens sp. LCG002]|uniref:nitrate reductase n=1 Tax=Marivivens sp. LCG002 TaxID=3051171 RepID=UPI002552DFB4|nr:nitrate reductase [Marivivens sp. LCG002]WIV50590.1 molybdopterin-dependent oxidoreductase [Marivivens sp. LCG002]
MSNLSPIRSTCAYCGVGCGIVATRQADGSLAISGDKTHPANFGRLCSKGSALGDTVGNERRLLHPMINGKKAEWDDALALVAAKFKATIKEHGADSVAFYVSGQLLTEDYYVANKLMKGFIGSANIDTNSRLCMASTVAGHKRAFGTDTVPGVYADIEHADLVVLVGSNLAWCHPVLYQRLAAAKAGRPSMKVINIDPRRTATSDLADLHLSLRIGTDVALFNHLLAQIEARGAIDPRTFEKVNGLRDALESAREDDVAVCGLEPREVEAFVQAFIGTQKVVTIFSQGVNQSSAGTDKVNAIINCHLATGRIGKEGMGPFSVTGQPNAMGGREVGGLANMLACHLDLEVAEHRKTVQEFWKVEKVPERPGLKAVDMFKAVADGKIKAIWIMCTNPIVSLPEADGVKAALEACDFVVVSDLSAEVETAKVADVLLPATGWGEKDGTVTNSDRLISRQRSLLPPAGAARHDWDIISEVGRRMGWARAFAYSSPAQIFKEFAALSAACAVHGRDFDISGLVDAEYDRMEPTRWPVRADGSQTERFFADGGYFTPSGKANAIPIRFREPVSKREPKYPYRLNTGRIRDQWHTMTRTGLSAKLGQHLPEPFVEIHPEDAKRLGIEPQSLVELTSPSGTAILRAQITHRVSEGELFVPIHWTDVFASNGRVDALVAAVVDPVSGQPESKASVVAAKPYAPAWYGFAVTQRNEVPLTDYWSRARIQGGWRIELAGKSPYDFEGLARSILGYEGELIRYSDQSKGTARFAALHDGKVVGALFIAPDPLKVSKEFIVASLGSGSPLVLAGRPAADMPDPGPIVCSCFSVGVNTILTAIQEGGLMTVDEIGGALRAGTNCGSCKPELAELLARGQSRQAAE